MNSEANVRYVVAGTPTGWAAMAKTIGDVDEDKIKNYKEDIDTLLVFTGLFSAVLTSFVIGSFQSLSPDKQDTMVRLLSQISTQTSSYTITGGLINSTLLPSSESSPSELFAPSNAALRTNYLWFASLIITLMTASFSMLVKQWLREYLAYDYTSPHERLRARQFRYPGLHTWKVFEIAGVLPVLLQLALGLFFLGLCFFTRSDLHGIGDMCAVLVALWASFFISATIAPAFSPRCPYKTTLLKSIMFPLRRYLRRLAVICRRCLGHPMRLDFVCGGLTVLSNMTSSTYTYDPKRSVQQFGGQFFIEETDAVKQEIDEVTLLGEVDAFLLDDDLLGTTVFDSLTQYYASPPTIISFVLQALTLRLKGSAFVSPLKSPPDLRRLTRRGWIAISDIVAVTVINRLSTDAQHADVWVRDAFYLLLAKSDQPLTPNALNAILRCIEHSTLPEITHTLNTLVSSSITADRLFDLLDPMSIHICKLLRERKVKSMEVFQFVLSFIAVELRQAGPSSPLKGMLDLRPLSQPVWSFTHHILTTAIESALAPTHNVMEADPWLEDAVLVLLSPSSYSLSTECNKALSALVAPGPYSDRLGDCMRPLTSPDSSDYARVLVCLHEVCKVAADAKQAYWLLKTIITSIPCTSKCRHENDSLAHLLLDHILRSRAEWAKCFTDILVERVQAITTSKGAWPPGAADSLVMLLSLPVSAHAVNPEIPRVLFSAICRPVSTASCLKDLISVHSRLRSFVVPEAALRCIESLVTKTNTEGRRNFIRALHYVVRENYPYESVRTSCEWIRNMNVIRFTHLIATIHANVRWEDDMADDWNKCYSSCAVSLAVFRDVSYPSLSEDEKVTTAELAQQFLEIVDGMEPTTKSLDQWVADFDVNSSILPDIIFEELLKFVPEVDAAARRCKRVRRLRQNVVAPAVENMTPEIQIVATDRVTSDTVHGHQEDVTSGDFTVFTS